MRSPPSFAVLRAGFEAIINDRWTEIETLNKRANGSV